MAELDFDARYSVDGMPGIAWYLVGYVQRKTEDTWWDGIHEEDRDWVVAVMVGDDRYHEIEVSELTPLDELDYCASCGQVGCTHDGRDRSEA